MSEATPRPWSIGHLRKASSLHSYNDLPIHCGAPGVNGGQGNVIAIVHMGGPGATSNLPTSIEANAEFIVRAVNCHDDLVQALHQMLPYARSRVNEMVAGMVGNLYPNIVLAELERAEAALAKAETP